MEVPRSNIHGLSTRSVPALDLREEPVGEPTELRFGQLDLVAVALVLSRSVQEVVVEAQNMLLKNAVSAAPLALDFENAATSASMRRRQRLRSLQVDM